MSEQKYYLPEPSHWPLVGSIGLFTTMFGVAQNPNEPGIMVFIGLAIVAFMMIGWFGTVIKESESGKYNEQVDMSFRMGMGWFIFSEVMFFAAFFGTLYYIRMISIPEMADPASATHNILSWNNSFEGGWPTAGPAIDKVNADAGTFKSMHASGIPLINTIILLTSGLTVTWAHWGIKKENRSQLVIGLLLTVLLGFTFIGLQAYEYDIAYKSIAEGGYGLTLKDGAYGSTFFMLTGFHGMHVLIGATILAVILIRSMKGHFTKKNHFAFEAAAWYWHFVDVVWLGLFIFVYWLI